MGTRFSEMSVRLQLSKGGYTVKQSELIYEQPELEVIRFETLDVITFSQGDPEKENIGKEDWDGDW